MPDDERVIEIERGLTDAVTFRQNVYQSDVRYLALQIVAQLDRLAEAERQGMLRAAEIAKTIGCEPCAEHIAAAIRDEAEKLGEGT